MVDRYTKIILTVIAANLTLMTIQGLDLVPQANAAGGVQKVAICNEDGHLCAMVVDSLGNDFPYLLTR